MILRPTIVVNVRTALDVVTDAKREGRFVDIMRPSKWGNPFRIVEGRNKLFIPLQFQCRSREEAVARHAEWLQTRPELLAALPELVGKVLGCCCMPKLCHGQELARLAVRLGK